MSDKLFRLSKKDLINNIDIYYLKDNKKCDGLFKLSKKKLIQLIMDNDIPIIDKSSLKYEIEETEKFNYYMEIIYYNFIKYNNVDIDIIRNLRNNQNINSTYLYDIIIKYNLKMDNMNKIENTKKFVIALFNSIHEYTINENIKNNIEYKTIPNIIKFLNNIIC